MTRRSRLGMALSLPLAVLLFFAGYLSQRSVEAAPSQDELATLHAGLGVDMSAGTLSDAALPPTLEEVGPVSNTFLGQLDSLRAVVADSPSNYEASLELAGLLQDAHLEAEAATHFERALGHSPSNRQAWLDLADVYGAQQRWADVRSAMERMLENFHGDPSAAYNMGVAFANSGDLDSAREWWTEAMNQGIDLEVSVLAKSSLAQISG